MQDRYLFHGKRLDNGEWVIGTYLPQYHSSRFGRIDAIFFSDEFKTYRIPVDRETVGQCTGLHAAKSYRGESERDRLIFEGDIIKLITADYEEITITCEFGTIRRQIFENEVEITGFYFVRSNDGRKTFPITHNYLGKHDIEIWEIIGNIHDKTEG